MQNSRRSKVKVQPAAGIEEEKKEVDSHLNIHSSTLSLGPSDKDADAAGLTGEEGQMNLGSTNDADRNLEDGEEEELKTDEDIAVDYFV